jgi:deoxyadenosine/deoxycytidine kinase
MFARPTVADFLLDKDPLFARLTLSSDELALYQRIYDSVRPQAPAPDLVVYLQASPATLVERVRRRGAGYERGISDQYLALLAESYARFFYHYDAAPVLIVNSENLNFVAREADLELLLERMRAMRSRREFFSRG